jgi:anti-anti-sigma factor
VGRQLDGDTAALLGVAVEHPRDSVAVVAVRGELDMSTIPRLERPLLDVLGASLGVVVDLTQLAFIDSSGIALLIEAQRTANGSGALHLVVSEGSQVARVFEITGIGRTVPLFLDREEAVTALNAASRTDGAR